jgi:hypothetical protein
MNFKRLGINFIDQTLGKLFRFFHAITVPRPTIVHNVQTYLSEMAVKQSADFVFKSMDTALIFDRREELWAYCVNRLRNRKVLERVDDPVIAEFGVFNGKSITYFAELLPEFKLHGFDSFVGLEEDWPGTYHPAGYFDLKGKLPSVPGNVTLHPGWFEETLPKFLQTLEGNSWLPALIHLDADTFTPTKYVLNSFAKHFREGSIVIFDEYLGYPFWQNGEYKAFQEFVNEHGIEFKYLACSGQQVAIEFC